MLVRGLLVQFVFHQDWLDTQYLAVKYNAENLSSHGYKSTSYLDEYRKKNRAEAARISHDRRYTLKFIITNPKTGKNVFGCEITENNPYISAYPAWHGKSYRDLQKGESVIVNFNLCGSSGYYRVTRTE